MFCIFVASRTTDLIQICIQWEDSEYHFSGWGLSQSLVNSFLLLLLIFFLPCPTFCQIFQTVYKYPFILLSRMSYAFDQGRVQSLYPFSEKISKDFSRTQDRFFPGLKILPYALSFPRLQSQFSLRSTYISHNVNSKNFIACLSKVDFQDFPDFPGPIQNLKVSYLGTQHKEPLQDSNLSHLTRSQGYQPLHKCLFHDWKLFNKIFHEKSTITMHLLGIYICPSVDKWSTITISKCTRDSFILQKCNHMIIIYNELSSATVLQGNPTIKLPKTFESLICSQDLAESITQNFMLFQTLGLTEKYASMYNAYKFKKLNLHYPNGALQCQYNQIGNKHWK